MAVQSGYRVSQAALVRMQHHRASVDYHCSSLRAQVRLLSAFLSSIISYGISVEDAGFEASMSTSL